MKNPIKLILLCLLAIACSDTSPKYKTPNYTAPDVSDLEQLRNRLANLKLNLKGSENPFICNKLEKDLPAPAAQLETREVTLEVKKQKTIRHNCSGNMIASDTEEPVGFTRDMFQMSMTDDLSSANAKLEFIVIKNHRTCKKLVIEADGLSADKNLTSQKVFSKGIAIDLQFPNAVVTTDGKVQFMLDLTNLQIGQNLAIVEGRNLIEIEANTKCLEMVAKPDPKKNAAQNCLKGDSFKTYSYMVDVKLHETVLPGSKNIDECKM